MRVLVVNSHHYRRGGDSAQFLDHVSALRSRGHEVAVFCMDHPDNLPSPWSGYWAPYVEYRGELSLRERVHAAARGTYSLEGRRGMRRLLRDFRPHVVHFHSIAHHLTLSVVDAALEAHTPTVWTLHDYRTVCPASALLRHGEVCERCAGGHFGHCIRARCKSGELSRSVAGALESTWTSHRGVLGRVSCFVSPSAFLARKVLALGLRPRRMEVVPNPVEPALASPVGTRARNGVLYVGRLSPEKGLDVVLRALGDASDTELRVLGDGPQRDEWRELARALGVRSSFIGWASADAVRTEMESAAALCVPSVWYENCPGVVLEAMSCRLPVVASDIGGLRELLDGGRAGRLAPPGDVTAWRAAVVGALHEPAQSAELAEQAFLRVARRHDPEAFITRIETIYRSLIN
jgi:glycosyltransferase involved in cell wall biosynthesis